MHEKKEEIMYTCGRTGWKTREKMRKNGTRGNARIVNVNKKNAHYSKKVRTYLLTILTNRGHVSEFSLGLTSLGSQTALSRYWTAT